MENQLQEVDITKSNDELGDKTRQYVCFILGEEEFGIEIEKVYEVIRYPEVTALPQMPEFIEGIINLRGKVISVMNLRKIFNLAEVQNNQEQKIMVIEINQKVYGAIVDNVAEVLDIESKQIQPPPNLGKLNTDFLNGIANMNERLLLLLNIESLFTNEELHLLGMSAALHDQEVQTKAAA